MGRTKEEGNGQFKYRTNMDQHQQPGAEATTNRRAGVGTLPPSPTPVPWARTDRLALWGGLGS